ncbi:MAG: ROK family protein [Cyclobacteriaceae bacterium]|jgi:polyphosphate glucokinase|nr:ROK family protein [Cyclobacteriaceae bacterium]
MSTPAQPQHPHNIFSIDIGGSSIKGVVLSPDGEVLQPFQKVKTPAEATPENVVKAICTLAANFTGYDRVSVGFPGYVKKGMVRTAPNLGTDAWKDVNLNYLVSDALDKPVRTANDADMHGLGVVRGKGLEMVITLGTGFGTAFLLDGNLLPHFELAHHPYTRKNTYDLYVGDSAFQRIGPEKWNKRVKKVLNTLKTVFNYDHLYIGGGNASEITFTLDDNITRISNKDGIKGGARLWKLDENLFMKAREKFLK